MPGDAGILAAGISEPQQIPDRALPASPPPGALGFTIAFCPSPAHLYANMRQRGVLEIDRI